MALDTKMTAAALIVADATLEQKVVELKKSINSKTELDDPIRAELAAAKAEHRELRREWRELRQWTVAVNAADAPSEGA